MRSRLRSLTPGPLSATVSVHSRGLRAALSATTGGASPRNFSALTSRFWNTRASSPSTPRTVGSGPTSTRAPAASICGARVSSRPSITRRRSTGSRRRGAAPDPRQVEQPVDEPGAVGGRRAQVGDDLLALGVDAALEQRGELGDGHERLAQVVRGDVGEALELGVRAAQLGLVALAGGDVVDDRGGADDVAGAVAQRRRGEDDVEQAAVLAHPLGLDALDALAGEDAAEARVLALEVLVAHERPHVLADDLRALVAEQAHGARVPVRDPPFAVGADDRVVGGLDDRGHQLGGGLGAAQVASCRGR